jgi:hypothetical protein
MSKAQKKMGTLPISLPHHAMAMPRGPAPKKSAQL